MLEVEYSSLKQYRSCPKKYQYLYVHKIAPAQAGAIPSVPLTFGTLLHNARENLAKGNSLDDVLAVFSADYAIAYDVWASNAVNFGQRTELVGRCLIRAYEHKWREELKQDTYTEVGFSVALNNDVSLRGKIDYVQDRSYGTILVDVKHSGASMWIPSPKLNHQLTGYAIAYEVMGNKRPDYVAVDALILPRYNDSRFFRSDKTRTPQLPEDDLALTLVQSNLHFKDSQLTDRDVHEWATWVDDTVSNILQSMDSNVYAMNAPDACTNYNRLCEYSPLCYARTEDQAQRLQDSLFEPYSWHPYE